MAGTLKVDTVQSSAASTPPVFKDSGGTEMGQLCRAWCSFNGVTTVTVRASFNVSSITRNASGDYTINFANALPDANYAMVIGGYKDTASGGNSPMIATRNFTTPGGSTTAQRIQTGQSGTSTAADSAYVDVAFFR